MSQRVANRWPRPLEAARGSRRGCRARRSGSPRRVPSSLANGWWPPSTSTMLRRRTPSAMPSARYVPRSFGPRCVIDVRHPVEHSRARSTGRGSPRSWTTPQIPHTARPTLVAQPSGRRPFGQDAGAIALAERLALRGLPSTAMPQRSAWPARSRPPPRPTTACVSAPSAIPTRSSSVHTRDRGASPRSGSGLRRAPGGAGPRRRGAALVHDHRRRARSGSRSRRPQTRLQRSMSSQYMKNPSSSRRAPRARTARRGRRPRRPSPGGRAPP